MPHNTLNILPRTINPLKKKENFPLGLLSFEIWIKIILFIPTHKRLDCCVIGTCTFLRHNGLRNEKNKQTLFEGGPLELSVHFAPCEDSMDRLVERVQNITDLTIHTFKPTREHPKPPHAFAHEERWVFNPHYSRLCSIS